MRRLHSESQFRHALFALQGADGYVEALLDMAREQAGARRAEISFGPAPAPRERRPVAPPAGAGLH
jgi:hypothetical protein